MATIEALEEAMRRARLEPPRPRELANLLHAALPALVAVASAAKAQSEAGEGSIDLNRALRELDRIVL